MGPYSGRMCGAKDVKEHSNTWEVRGQPCNGNKSMPFYRPSKLTKTNTSIAFIAVTKYVYAYNLICSCT